MTTADHLPESVLDEQYSRCALYLSHIDFYARHVRPRLAAGLRAVEFGGSNGFVRDLFVGVDYEVAPNAPEVDVHALTDYPSEGYDFVVLDEILEHVERPWVAIDEIHRVLKPGGCLLTSSPFLIAEHKVPLDYWRFTKDGLRVLLRPFRQVETYSWGNPGSVRHLLNGMMVTTREVITAGEFDLTDVEKFAIDVWAYAWK